MEPEDRTNYYVEPVEIEIYLKKSGKVRTIIKDLFVELIDVVPATESGRKIFDHFRGLDQPIDLMEIMNEFPEYMRAIYDSYYQNIELFEKLSMHFQSGLAGSLDSLRLALYFTELLLKYEPTVASTRYIGDFQTHNLNYLIRKLNALGESFALEDGTVSYLIKRYYQARENDPPDPEFDKLVELWKYNVRERPM
ncbi:MAG TPA: hypothetical protein ENN21_07325 [Spirochaetes bacterium]|nr:hypothetical protein [Spirochaetota bacterium]